ncbi:keratin, type I cytoskeletal 13-like [Lepisosteus oculatus]|uniref:keratin, type I cytoskeletal 13-like n=1 Tax=Lepisosteus oculatus TaxID=7918 RepID=UPI00371FC242
MSSFSSFSSFSIKGGARVSTAPRASGGWGSSAGSFRGGAGGLVAAHRTPSVHGGAGGWGTRISTASASAAGGGGFGSAGAGLSFGAFSLESALGDGGGALGLNNGQQTMQNLNDRLAKYLEKVRSLEAANAKLEQQIREWGVSQTVTSRDHSTHDATIKDLSDKILAALKVNSELAIQMDNIKLAADDFRVKYENELNLRQSVEADIAGLKKVMSDLALAKTDLEMQIEGVKDEMAFLKKNHEEESQSYRSQLTGQIQVEVDAAPAVDLNKVIEEIREQYEGLVAKNRRDAEAWFNSKAEVVQKEVKESTESLQTSTTELKEGKQSFQNLELELQSLYATKQSLEGTVADTEARFSAQMGSLQTLVTSLETQLTQLRADTARVSEEYQVLLGIKTRLEKEIEEYRRLLDGGSAGSQAESSLITEKSGVETKTSVTKKVVTVVEELVDGKVVRSSSKLK